MVLISWLSSSLFVEKFPNISISKSFLEIVNFPFSLLGWGVRGGSWYLCSGSSADERGGGPFSPVFAGRILLCSVLRTSQSSVMPHVLSPQPLCLSCPRGKKFSDLLEGAEERSVSDARGLGFSCSLYHLFDLFIGCGESSLLHVGFLLLQRARATLACDAWASHCGSVSCSSTQALGVQASVFAALGL